MSTYNRNFSQTYLFFHGLSSHLNSVTNEIYLYRIRPKYSCVYLVMAENNLYPEFESDLDALIFEQKHKVVRSLAEVDVLSKALPKQKEKCDEIVENLKKESGDKEFLQKELLHNWSGVKYYTEQKERAEKELAEHFQVLHKLQAQKEHFLSVHKQ